jgi:hypothetical protein
VTHEQHEEIWLAPECGNCADSRWDRAWCQNNVWTGNTYDGAGDGACSKCGAEGVRYILAKIADQKIADAGYNYDGAMSDLSAAVEMLRKHGDAAAQEWLALNYPKSVTLDLHRQCVDGDT